MKILTAKAICIMLLALISGSNLIAEKSKKKSPTIQAVNNNKRILSRLKKLSTIAIPATVVLACNTIPAVDGGPIASVVCGTVCGLVHTIGCGAGGWILGLLNPGVGIVYASVCQALSGAPTASCTAVCLALPIP